jgi:hypothetical protein
MLVLFLSKKMTQTGDRLGQLFFIDLWVSRRLLEKITNPNLFFPFNVAINIVLIKNIKNIRAEINQILFI